MRNVVHDLSNEGASIRRIASITSLHRNTVLHILGQPRPEIDHDIYDYEQLPQRCPGCGSLIWPPCIACMIREKQKRGDTTPIKHPNVHLRYKSA